MPEDFEFEFTYGVEGFFYFSSKENVISNGYFTSENKRQTTELVLSDDQKNEIWSIIQKYKLLNYKSVKFNIWMNLFLNIILIITSKGAYNLSISLEF